jgi:outer membrane biosynthesis protein TonB
MPRRPRESTKPWLILFILLSIIAHLMMILALLIVGQFIPKEKLDQAPQLAPSVSLSLEPPPPALVPPPAQRPKHQTFMLTQPDDSKPQQSPIISDNDNQLKSRDRIARNNDSVLPDMTGQNKRSLEFQDTTYAPQSKPQQASPQSQANKAEQQQQQKVAQKTPPPKQPSPSQTQVAQQQPPPDQPPPKPPPQPTPPKPTPPAAREVLDPNGLPVLPPINAPTIAPPDAADSAARMSKAQAARPPPSFKMNKSDNAGASGVFGDNSPQAMATALGRYKAQVYRAVGSRWYAKVNNALQLLPVGTVRIDYTIHSDGRIEITADPQGDASPVMMLHSISYNSMIEAAPFPPFSDALKREVGDSFSDYFVFSIYGG